MTSDEFNEQYLQAKSFFQTTVRTTVSFYWQTPTSDSDLTNDKLTSLERSIMELRKRIKRQDEELKVTSLEIKFILILPVLSYQIIGRDSIVTNSLKTLSGLFSPNLIDQSSCKMSLVLACVVRTLHDDWSIRLGEYRLDKVSDIW